MEDGSLNERAALLVKYHIFAASCMNMKIVVSRHSGDLVGIYSCRVDNYFCIYALTINRVDSVVAVLLFYRSYLKIKSEISAVVHSVANCGYAKLVGAYYRTRRCEQSAGKLGIEIRLKLKKLASLKYFQALNAVLDSSFIYRLYLCALVLKSNDERFVAKILYSELFGNTRHHLRAAHVHLRLERALLSVKSRVNYRAVCLCSAHCDVVLLLEHADIQLVFCKAASDHSADYACADYYYIVHLQFFLFLIFALH